MIDNHLLDTLPRKDRARLLAAGQQHPLVLSQVLNVAGQATPYVYFPTVGFISLVTMVNGKPGLELGMVGSEGMLGAHLALGVMPAPLHAVVQGEGSAWRIPSKAFLGVLADSPALQRSMQRYNYVRMVQLAAAAACLRFHLIGPRLARWLLMSHDNARADTFHMTHEFLSYMLGVRRVGITAAAGAMQRNGLVAYHRGEMTILDRAGLEAASCDCYAQDRKTFTSLLP